jgi:hypothetical protein
MKCVISNVETNNKWRNLPLCKEFVEMAKDMVAEDASKWTDGKSPMTVRMALLKLQEQWQADKAKAAIHNG